MKVGSKMNTHSLKSFSNMRPTSGFDKDQTRGASQLEEGLLIVDIEVLILIVGKARE